jgi:nucleoside-diphosphate-sugar epimerase
MKIILTGTTGFIGSEVLAQCLRTPAITSIVVLSRRPLPETVSADGKVQVIVMKDFKTYPEAVIKQLEGADACIWYLPAAPFARMRRLTWNLR